MKLQQLTITETAPLAFDEAVRDFLLHQRTYRNSPQTIRFYEWSFGVFGQWLSETGIEDLRTLGTHHLRRFLAHLEDRMKPTSAHGVMRGVRALLRFLHAEELLAEDPVRKVKMPKTDKTVLPAFTEQEVGALLKTTEGKDPASIRNRAIILLLLDSGLRLSECASLKVGDVDLASGNLKVMGKGRKERVSRIGATALRAFTKYARLRGGETGEPLWLGRLGPMTARGIAEALQHLGERAGVHAHPHKFRRTCALYLLRNGADVFSVQYLLGHSDLQVLRRYLAQTEQDVTEAHARFSPVDRLR